MLTPLGLTELPRSYTYVGCLASNLVQRFSLVLRVLYIDNASELAYARVQQTSTWSRFEGQASGLDNESPQVQA